MKSLLIELSVIMYVSVSTADVLTSDDSPVHKFNSDVNLLFVSTFILYNKFSSTSPHPSFKLTRHGCCFQ